ncbi:MAG TPA: pro-sigmaK processing inhibitor BofA family protein [Candidatus Methanoculleus thermohydrogenotrophicum]|jgi:pro-sigmaK processing inhibitor BofA|nr:pro-sigmaK processing inhibitor BofA family protein [Candidatus Methanoculleus thermohydrogenotrophicum]NLM81113.1 sigmaK-factor processing regulatory BofA [Candidatus Methanoculleus thermohydrogenotrophicum]HOB17143.1 pro-sigmaK processing inhibitor BofA family protein [Candidatus Methanoculleus thermohydrogenotrophicum]HPZ37222.1 pro-sigmaK processing inhibitor BofA family protein [Candidatus Methanoculleus thermohydrogenotrophicum]HQC90564.1 pro-sigmaK processing inhibitor BofA family pro
MMEEILAILLAVAIAVAIYYLMKKFLTLVINAIAGLITLWILNYFNVLAWFGAPDVQINLVTVLICALGGLPGALIVVLLHLFGITL